VQLHRQIISHERKTALYKVIGGIPRSSFSHH
jgi:hypothetical protein